MRPFRSATTGLAILALSLLAAAATPAVAEAGRLRLAAPAVEAAPAPDALGPYEVGRVSFSAEDPARPGRELDIDVWYPAQEGAAAGPAFYPLLLVFGIFSDVALDAPPASDAGPFPLVVFSHGSGGIRFQSYFLCETLASHGFVVAASDHPGNTAFDALFGTSVPFLQSAVDRPRDVSFVIDTMLARNATPDDLLEGRIDPERIGVTGHSFGGYTSLAMISGFGPVAPDPRVDVIAPIAPASLLLRDDELAAITVPTLVLGGTLDITTPVDPESRRPYKLIRSNPRYRVDLQRAGHASFTNICDIAALLDEIGIDPAILDSLESLIQEGCAPELLPIGEAQRLTNLYVVAFLRRFLAGDDRYAHYLTPELAAERALPVDFYAIEGRERIHP